MYSREETAIAVPQMFVGGLQQLLADFHALELPVSTRTVNVCLPVVAVRPVSFPGTGQHCVQPLGYIF